MFAVVRGHTIYTPPLNRNSVILDLGANHGEFSRQLKERFGGTYYLAEANPALAGALSAEKQFHVWHCAVTGRDGTVNFKISELDEASRLVGPTTTDGESETDKDVVTLIGRSVDSLITEVPSAEIDLIKMDIEGAEGQALLHIPAETLARIGQITIEFHSDPCFGLDTAREVQESIRYLRRNGFLFLNFSGTMLTDVLFVNRRQYRIPYWKGKLWEWAGVRPQWLRKLRQLIPPSARTTINRILDRATDRDRNK